MIPTTMSYNIQLMSDLHLEYKSQQALPATDPAKTLVLAGDIAVGANKVAAFLNTFSQPVVYVAGNHEYYGYAIDSFNKDLKSQLNSNVHFLNNETVTINGITFAGTTLWTNFQEDIIAECRAQDSINDFTRIKVFGTKACAKLQNEAVEFLKGTKRDITVTHFLPSNKCTHPKYGNSNINKLNKYFANDLDYLITTPWLHGHTHDKVDTTINGHKVVANPRGYPNENNTPYKILEL